MWWRRVFVGCGALFLATLMLIGALSIGVYLGERGVLGGRAQLAPGPGGPLPPGAPPLAAPGAPPAPAIAPRATPGTPPTPAAPPLAAPGGPPNVIGTLQRYGDNAITLNTMQGPRTINLTPETAVRGENAAAQVADLRPGMALAVWGDPGERGRVLVARVIVILPAQQK